MLSHFNRVQICATLWTEACQAPLSVGFPRQEYWSGLPFPPPGDRPNPGIERVFPALAGGFLTFEPPGKPKVMIKTGGSRLRCPGDCVLCHCSDV